MKEKRKDSWLVYLFGVFSPLKTPNRKQRRKRKRYLPQQN